MLKSNTFITLLVAALMLPWLSPARAAVTANGAINVTYPTWNRITDRSGYPLSANTGMPYEVLEIRTTTAGDTLTATINNTSQIDSFLALYSSFSPASPQTNLLAADDDGNGYPHAKLTSTVLAANTSYYLVISSYSGDASAVYPRYGGYSLTLGGAFSIVPQVTTTTVNASPNPSVYGQSVTLTATVGKGSGIAPPTGTVTFKDGSATLGSGALNANGQASLAVSSLTMGVHTITASYAGETKYAASTSVAYTLTISQFPTVSSISPASGSASGGTMVTVSGTNLADATSVTFGGNAAASYTIESDTQITATTPAGASWASAPVTVANANGVSNGSVSFQYLGAPTNLSATQPSGLISWWRGEWDAIDLIGGNNGIIHSSANKTTTVAENATAILACDSGATIVSSYTSYGANGKYISCGSCTYGSSSCGITFSNTACGSDPIPGTAKQGALTITCEPVSGSVFAAGKTGEGFSFNGSSDYISKGASYKGTASNSFTMEFWAKPETTITASSLAEAQSGYAGISGQRYAIFPENQNSSTDAGAGVSVGSNKIAVIEHSSDYMPSLLVYDLVPGDILSDGWMHVAMVYDAKTPKLYVNGLLRRTGLTSLRTNVYPSSSFGEAGYGYGWYQGLLDEIHIYNRALTMDEIRSVYVAGGNGLSITPAVTAVTPANGTASGGTTVTIIGNFFTGAKAVAFGVSSATSVTVVSDTKITAVSPAGVAGQIADITVTTPGGTSAVSSADQFTYTQDQAKNQTTSTSYASLSTALSTALSGAEIRGYGTLCDGVFTLDKSINLRGGWDGAFLTRSSTPTTLHGVLTVTGGDSNAESIIIKGQLVTQGGSLSANDVTITQ
ncbi:MAG: Ig-like domain repeat protein [Desulfuromonadales bacterium]|nr:Ig-like domain repeat protein [Desulfuromonadales bacterium]